MSPKESKFVREYLVDGNGAAAAVRAGYGVGGAKVAACRLLTKDNVQKALQAHQNADANRLGLAREDVLAGLLGAINQARMQANPRAMISGWRQIARLMGFYTPEVRETKLSASAQATTDRYEAMSDAELLEIIAGGVAI